MTDLIGSHHLRRSVLRATSAGRTGSPRPRTRAQPATVDRTPCLGRASPAGHGVARVAGTEVVSFPIGFRKVTTGITHRFRAASDPSRRSRAVPAPPRDARPTAAGTRAREGSRAFGPSPVKPARPDTIRCQIGDKALSRCAAIHEGEARAARQSMTVLVAFCALSRRDAVRPRQRRFPGSERRSVRVASHVGAARQPLLEARCRRVERC